MNHLKRGRKLNRTSEHREALLANMATSLIQHERVITTPQKAKEVKRFVERLVTLAKKGGLPQRRRALALLKHSKMEGVSAKGNPTMEKVTGKLFDVIGPRFADRNGGYTRIVRLGGSRRGEGPVEMKYRLNDEPRVLRLSGRRLGDGAEQVILEFVGSEGAMTREEEEPDEE